MRLQNLRPPDNEHQFHISPGRRYWPRSRRGSAGSFSEIRRIAIKGFDLAMARRKKVTSVDKSNVLETSRLWRETVIDVAKGYPEVELEHLLVDAMTMHMLTRAQDFDVVLTENMFGDILKAVEAALTGGHTTGDLGGGLTTFAVGQWIAGHVGQ